MINSLNDFKLKQLYGEMYRIDTQIRAILINYLVLPTKLRT